MLLHSIGLLHPETLTARRNDLLDMLPHPSSSIAVLTSDGSTHKRPVNPVNSFISYILYSGYLTQTVTNPGTHFLGFHKTKTASTPTTPTLKSLDTRFNAAKKHKTYELLSTNAGCCLYTTHRTLIGSLSTLITPESVQNNVINPITNVAGTLAFCMSVGCLPCQAAQKAKGASSISML